MVITDEIIEQIEVLSKLSLSDNDREIAKKDMQDVLNYVNQIESLELEKIEPAIHGDDIQNVFREDVVLDYENKEQLTKGAPSIKDGLVSVPNTF